MNREVKHYDASAILARGYPAVLDLYEEGGFEIDDIYFEDGEARLVGTWTRPDGKKVPGEMTIRPAENLDDVFVHYWQDWTVEEVNP